MSATSPLRPVLPPDIRADKGIPFNKVPTGAN